MPVRVVIFEDDPLTLEMLQKCLVSRGYEVICFSEPQLCPIYSDPCCQCPAESPCGDILITDNYMPRMTGLEFIAQQNRRGCKGISRYKAIISGNLTARDQELARELGCRVFPKPIVLQDLFDWLQECRTHYTE